MRTIECWRLESVTDYGPYVLVARFSSQQAAKDAEPAAGGYGPEIRNEVIVIYDSAVEFDPVRFDVAARLSGLAKLTDAERRALGLSSASAIPTEER